MTDGTYQWNSVFCTEISAPPCTFVVFGASGDLAGRKLFPALFSLTGRKLIDGRTQIVGCGRTDMNDAEFRSFLRKKWLDRIPDAAGNTLENFLERIHYFQIRDYSDPLPYRKLERFLTGLDRESGPGVNPHPSGRIYYLSVPPFLCEPIVSRMHAAGLLNENDRDSPWRRVILEKPFGSDIKSARELESFLHRHLHERQIYRIDHYLGKETVQNIMIMRFANIVFEPVWNRRFVDFVKITVAETVGVERRAGYFDGAGLVKDMFQNHIFEMLSLAAMEMPDNPGAESHRGAKLELLNSVLPVSSEDAVRGQYDGYLKESGVPPDSRTETFAAMRVFIENERWHGVPFLLVGGKKMAEKRSSISIHFKKVPRSIFPPLKTENMVADVLTLHIQPDEGFTLSIQAKRPGPKLCLGALGMDFKYASILENQEKMPDSYERLLLDCMLGDRTLFLRCDSILRSWEILSPVLEEWKSNPEIPLWRYPPGSWGPEAANRILGVK